MQHLINYWNISMDIIIFILRTCDNIFHIITILFHIQKVFEAQFHQHRTYVYRRKIRSMTEEGLYSRYKPIIIIDKPYYIFFSFFLFCFRNIFYSVNYIETKQRQRLASIKFERKCFRRFVISWSYQLRTELLEYL